MNVEERLAILENELAHNKQDNDKFFKFLREHMEKENTDRTELVRIMGSIKTRVDRQTFFVSGVAFTIIAVWGVAKFIFQELPK